METVEEYNNLRIPTWALSYLVNADDSGITEEDKKLVDDYMKFYENIAEQNDASIIFSPETNQEEFEKEVDKFIDAISSDLKDKETFSRPFSYYTKWLQEVMSLKEMKNETKEAYFTWQPEFGPGCDVQECTILIAK